MKVEAKIQKWGNGLAIRIAGLMRDVPHFKEGMSVEVEVSEEGLDIRKLQVEKRLVLPFTEAALLKGMTPQTAHADIIAAPVEGEF